MPWIAPLVAVTAPIALNALGITGGGGGGGGSAPPGGAYTAQGLSAADTGWQNLFKQQQNIAGDVSRTVSPLYAQSLAAQQGINYNPYLQASSTAGQQYGELGNIAAAQGGQYGQMADIAGRQQGNLYGAAADIARTGFDPQSALFQQSQQQLQDQIRAGQAARGLGVSPVGAAEENQAMSQFDINWQNQQLARQAQAIQAMSQASQAGGTQGQLQGANLAAQMQALGQIPGYTQQAGQIPIQAQQYVAAQPAQAAQGYQTNMGQLANMYGNVAGQAIPYMYQGSGAQQAQQAFNAQQQAAMTQGITNIAGGLVQSYNTPGSWLSNTFGGGGGGGGASQTPTNLWSQVSPADQASMQAWMG